MANLLTLDAEITELSPHGGDGVAICAIDGERRAVFVPNVLTGEQVRVEVDPKTRPARGRLLEVLRPSPSRVSPPCAHVARCGGCDWMHLAPNEQATEHARIVKRLLGEAAEGVDVTSHPAPQVLGYRTRARVHVETTRKDHVNVGMFGRRSHEPAVVDTCVVLDPVLDRARASLATLLLGAKGKGEAHLALGNDRRAVIDLHFRGELPGAIFGRLERATKEGELAGARVFEGDVRTPAKIGDPTPIIEGADGLPLRLAMGGFAQASEQGNKRLASHVADLARILVGDGSKEAGLCVELYAGAGNLTILLARDRPTLIAVEQDKEACAIARENLAARGLSRRVIEADASTFTMPKGTSLVVLDPPREGARAVAEALAQMPAKKAPAIVYVACDPPTLARDVKILVQSGNYDVRRVDTFEMFPQTSHVETVVLLSPRAQRQTAQPAQPAQPG